ncbi:hypothetical protein AN958_00066, partial [Leucoagaricus sp. SymC.cos]
FRSAVATFYAPSDVCGTNGMTSERIRAVPLWKKQGSRYDTIFVKQSPDNETISTGLQVARARLFFSFIFQGEMHKCALIEHYHFLDSMPDEDSGMWTVRPMYHGRFKVLSIIPISKIYRASHLLPFFASYTTLPQSLTYDQTLDYFKIFYVNRYIDYHAFEIA